MRRMWRVVHALEVRSKWMGRNLGVTGPQRLVVRVVGRYPDIGASEIAANLEMHPSTLTGILSRLEQAGYLQRAADPDDLRRARFRLTPRGHEIDRERTGTVEAAITRALSRSGDAEVIHTESVMQRIVEELERAAIPTSESRKRSPGKRRPAPKPSRS